MTDRLSPPWHARVEPERPGDGASLRHEPAARYLGTRLSEEEGRLIVVAREDSEGRLRTLPLQEAIRNHSAEFNWGYGGSGPAQLALAILTDAIGATRAEVLYQDFKWQVIAGLQADKWSLTREDVIGWLSWHEAKDTEG